VVERIERLQAEFQYFRLADMRFLEQRDVEILHPRSIKIRRDAVPRRTEGGNAKDGRIHNSSSSFPKSTLVGRNLSPGRWVSHKPTAFKGSVRTENLVGLVSVALAAMPC